MKWPNALHLSGKLLRDTCIDFWREKTWRKAAAIAFYTLFTAGPMLALILHFGGVLTDNNEVRETIIDWLHMVVGEEGAESIESLLDNFSLPKSGLLSYFIGAYMLFSGGINAVGHMRETINGIFHTEEDGKNNRSGWFSVLVDAGFVLATTVLILASALVGVVFYYMRSEIDLDFPFINALSRLLGIVISLAILTLAICGIYHHLPARKLSWKGITYGALLTAPLFLAERFLMLTWMTNTSLESVYGSISFMVVFLLWAYISVQVVLFGAAFAVVAEKHIVKNKEQINAA